MITRFEIDFTALGDAELQTQHYGHSFMVEHHLSALPKTTEGTVDISQLTENAGSDLISPITRFQRLVGTQVRLNQIREELTRRGLEPTEPKGNH